MIISIILMVIFVTALVKKVPVYDSMRKGASDGIGVLCRILPSMIVILSAVSMLRASGVMEFLVGIISPVAEAVGIPEGVIPMALLRPMSGSGAFGILSDTISAYGADSREGIIASIIMGSSETTFYTLAVYFGATSAKKTKIPLAAGLSGDVFAVICAAAIVRFIIGI